MSDNYVKATITVRQIRSSAVRVDEGWIPRSVIHSADEAFIVRHAPTGPITIRIRKWKAEELGL